MKQFFIPRRGLLLLAFLTVGGLTARAQNGVGIGTTAPNASAALDIVSSTKGILLPRLTVGERGLIASPATGLIIFQTNSTPGYYYYDGAAWQQLTTASASSDNFIQNQTTSAQTAGYNISGAGTVGGLLTAGSATLGSTTIVGATNINTSGGALTNIGTTGGAVTNIGTTGGAVTNIGTSGGAVTNIGTGGGAGTVSIGTGSGTGNVSIGRTNGTNTVRGTTGITGTTTINGTTSINTNNTTTAVTNIGTGNNAGIVSIGRDNGTVALPGLNTDGIVTNSAAGVLGTTTFAALATSLGTNFIQNGTTLQASSNFNISGNGLVGGNVGVGITSPSARLDVAGSTRLRGLTTAGVVTTDALGNLSSSTATTAFGTDFIQNGTTQQAMSNFNISGDGTIGGSAVAKSLQAVGTTAVGSQGAYLQWNRLGGDGSSWLLNQKGTGGSDAGIRFGRVTTGDAVTEWARFIDNGFFGLNTSPTALLDVNGSTRLRGLTTAGVVQTDALGNLSSSTGSASFIQNQTTLQAASNFNISGNGFVGGSVGIGTTAPHAPLQLANTDANRKLVLFEANNNDHQFLGFGSDPNTLRYQVASASYNHIFYRGNDSGTSVELLRIGGDGNVGIGTPSPSARLDVDGDFKLGTNGTVLASVIKATVFKTAIGPIGTNSAVTVTFAVPNAVIGATVAISPANDLVNGANISYARVSSPGTVTVKFSNSTGSSINVAAGNYYLTVIQ